MVHPSRILVPLIAAVSVAAAMGHPEPAHAGVLRPVLQLMRPQLETRLTRICMEAAGSGIPELQGGQEDLCRKLAVPTSKCLVEETDATGRGLGVITELLGGRFGDDSEVVVKRCLARMFGLPADILQNVPLRELGRRFAARRAALGMGGGGGVAGGRPVGGSPAGGGVEP